MHRDLAGFDFDSSKVDQDWVRQRATLSFTDTAQSAVLIGRTGTAKTHLPSAIAVSGIASKGKQVRFYSTVDLVNVLEAGEARRQSRADCAISDTHGPHHFGRTGGTFHLARPAGLYGFTCCPSYTSIPASSSRRT